MQTPRSWGSQALYLCAIAATFYNSHDTTSLQKGSATKTPTDTIYKYAGLVAGRIRATGHPFLLKFPYSLMAMFGRFCFAIFIRVPCNTLVRCTIMAKPLLYKMQEI
jgi:hypothetical protein